MENFQRIASGLDVAPLLNAIWGQPELWKQIVARQLTPGSPHKDTETIFLRWAEKLTVEDVFTAIPAVDYPALDRLPEAKSLISQIMSKVGSNELGRVIITKLRPGGSIDTHADEGAYADHYERFHLALTADGGAWFTSYLDADRAETVRMWPGELYWFHHKREHTYVNCGDTDRIHLIVDCVAPLFRRERDAA